MLSAIQHYQPSLRRCLNGSWRLFKTWQRFEIPARAPPMTWQIVQVPMGFLHRQSPQVALSLGVAFRCRTRELLSLQARDMFIPAASRCAIWYRGETKTGPRNPHAGTVSCHDFNPSPFTASVESNMWPTGFPSSLAPISFSLNFQCCTFFIGIAKIWHINLIHCGVAVPLTCGCLVERTVK